MHFDSLKRSIRLTPEKQRFIRQHGRLICAWPALCLILGAVLWALLASLLDSDRQHLEKEARVDASMLSATYARQISHTIGELDHITALLKSNWERSQGHFRLEQIRSRASFIDPTLVAISISNRDGVIVSSTLYNAVGMSITGRDYFKHHTANPSPALYIGAPLVGRFNDKEIVTFTRRLDRDDGQFDGIITASTGTPFLAASANKSTLGATGILALVGQDGILRAAKVGSETDSLLQPSVITRDMLASGPDYSDVSRPGWFADGVLRYLASVPVPGYPLHAVVGLGQPDVLEPLQNARATYVKIGLGGTCMLVLFAVIATVMSLRLAWRRHREELVRQTYRVATEGANEGFYMWRPIYGSSDDVLDYELVDCNERGAELYGSQRTRILGGRLKTLYSDPMLEQLLATAQHVMRSGYYEDEFQTTGKSLVKSAWLHRKFVRAEDGIAVTLRDISERKRLEQERDRMSEQDSLTGLPNRHWLAGYMPVALAQAAVRNGLLAILFVDLDKFKAVNDTWGHSTGDQLLQAVVRRLRGVLRPSDRITRFGGDEFIIVLEGIARDDDAAEVAHRINAALEEPFQVGSRECQVGASIGISLFPKDGGDAETLIRNADIAMYTVKSGSKGHYRFYDQEFYARIQTRREMEAELVQALEQDQFVLHYQPRVDARSGRLLGLEALVRWQHPLRGLVYPGDFIPIAEGSGLILQLGAMVMDKVCAQLVQWREGGLDVVPVSVNASARQFNEGSVDEMLAAHVERHGLPASLIEIELTESIMVSNAEQVYDQLTALHAMGVSVHLDDFGTGYSSLSILHKLDVDVLKIDRAFTAQLGTGKEGEILFKAIISMAKALDMRVVAEGVEHAEQLSVLQQLGCDEIQGYLVSRPLPAAEVQRFLRPEMTLLDAAAMLH
ncbi:bifunctional diguanylate cyclase/phosphodiesterase [Noviherbaspirillum aerium]|uniref:bifunctional diguanylate cyclase/phosphodiesterase n=1 Tax=Noviherbaspirillum aerium TaxID=2588497 RepID=UPI00178C820C|nr:EAL domain-containing protein [Noviherbaspirillum aerium]